MASNGESKPNDDVKPVAKAAKGPPKNKKVKPWVSGEVCVLSLATPSYEVP